MEGKPLNQKGPERVKPAEKPAVSPGPLGGTLKGSAAGPVKPTAAKPTPLSASMQPPLTTKMSPVATKKAPAMPVSKKKVRVTPDEASKIRAAVVDKLSKAPEGMRTVDLAKALDISTSKLTFVASDLLKSGKIKKVEIEGRVVYCSKDAKVTTPAMERDRVFKDAQALLRAAPKGMKITDIAAKTKHSRQKLAAALKPHVDSGEIKKVGDVYLLTGRPAVEPAKKAAAPVKPNVKPQAKKAPEKREPPKVPPKPIVKPAYRAPEKVKTGKAIAWLACILAVVSIILWLSVWGDDSATRDKLATLKNNFEQKTKAIDKSISAMYIDMNTKLKTADMKVLNTFFNQQITSLEATLVNLDGLSRMTNDEATLTHVAETKATISALIQQLRAEYVRTVPK